MLRIVQLISWQDAATQEEIDAVCRLIDDLVEQIPEVRSCWYGRDSGAGDHDFGVVMDFDDGEAYHRFQDHPLHVEAATGTIRPLIRESVRVLHETGPTPRPLLR